MSQNTAPTTAPTLAPTSTLVAVVVTRVYHQSLSARVKECGDTYRFETHLDAPSGVSVRVACLCPEGHGVAHLPWRGWFTSTQGKYDLMDIPTPQRVSYLSTEPVEVDEAEVDAEVDAEDILANEFAAPDMDSLLSAA